MNGSLTFAIVPGGGDAISKATISDIARRSGLSTATVDRVLNARAGVRAANRHRVFKAAQELGYLPSEGAVVVPSRPAHLEFMIPFDGNEFMHEVRLAIESFAAASPLVAECRVHITGGIGPDELARALTMLSPATTGVGVMTTDHPRTRRAISHLAEAGIPVVTIASDIPEAPRAAYVGVRDRIGGRAAGRMLGLLCGPGPSEVAVFMGSRDFHGHREREMGFHETMETHFPQIALLDPVETGEDVERTRSAMTTLLRNHPALRGVYCVGSGRAGVLGALGHLRGARPRIVMHDLTASSRKWLLDGAVDCLIDQDARLVGEQSVVRLLGAMAAGSPLLSFSAIEPRIILRENLPVR